MTLLDVVVDEAGIAPRRVQAFAQVLEKDPYQHRTDRHSDQCQSGSRLRLRDSSGKLTTNRDRISSHGEPRLPWMLHQTLRFDRLEADSGNFEEVSYCRERYGGQGRS